MSKSLDVYLHQTLVGQLVQDKNGQMGFRYAPSWLDNPQALPLSHSLPLQAEKSRHRECQGFFGGILPEESKREIIARNLGISARNDFSMLEQIGGECAGAVTFLPSGERLPEASNQYRTLTDTELAEILRILPRRPLMAGEAGVRLSLAGAQDKLAVLVSNGAISLPLGSAPSSHILKPAIERFEDTVFNEFLCMQLAAAVGLHVAPTSVASVEGIDYLLVGRYDRKQGGEGEPSESLVRLHQEDFCQAYGIAPQNKYQSEGGPSLAQCFALVREVSTMPVIDLQRLLDAVIFNLLIGNNDAHAKNFSLVYHDGRARLAPLYDLLSTAFYPELTAHMAMKLGGESRVESITPKNLDQFASEAGLAKPMVRQRLRALSQAVLSSLDAVPQPHPAMQAVAAFIRQRGESLLSRFTDASSKS